MNKIEKLRRDHPVDDFDCGVEPLNEWLIKYALMNQQSDAAQVYLALIDGVIAGYYALASGSVERDDAPPRVAHGLARHPVPIMLLARLAVSKHHQGQGVGKELMRDAMERTVNAAGIPGIRALVTHAKDETARAFYERFDFVPSPTNRFHMFVLLKDIRYTLGIPE